MSFTWEHFLEVAHELADCPSRDHLREAKFRSAISRAYYASFHHARGHYKARYGAEPPGSGSGREHKLLPAALMQSGSRAEEEAGDQLNMLRGLRREADYELSLSPDGLLVSRSLHLATETINMLRA